ncbi:hypothetical protein Bbelb_243800 [Branchiostoma belcheri]|nr:hypothetical protein Bbelb_243800 [Branchiostoma belcheri]
MILDSFQEKDLRRANLPWEEAESVAADKRWWKLAARCAWEELIASSSRVQFWPQNVRKRRVLGPKTPAGLRGVKRGDSSQPRVGGAKTDGTKLRRKGGGVPGLYTV